MRKPLTPRPCAQCGTVFKPTKQANLLCSWKCQHAAQRTVPDQTCERCGKVFHRADALTKKHPVRFCSRACYHEHKTYLCQHCGQPFWRKARGPMKFCGNACKFEAAKTGRPRRHGLSGAYVAWRTAVIRRDKVCRLCGSDQELQAHHIERWVDAPDLRHDVANGILLCRPCHQDQHPEGGVGMALAANYDPHCSVCNVPIGRYTKTGTCPKHRYSVRKTDHYKQGLRCSVCGILIGDRSRMGLCRKHMMAAGKLRRKEGA